jgi:hypothetical protein
VVALAAYANDGRGLRRVDVLVDSRVAVKTSKPREGDGSGCPSQYIATPQTSYHQI